VAALLNQDDVAAVEAGLVERGYQIDNSSQEVLSTPRFVAPSVKVLTENAGADDAPSSEDDTQMQEKHVGSGDGIKMISRLQVEVECNPD
jgi:hypothetical protein